MNSIPNNSISTEQRNFLLTTISNKVQENLLMYALKKSPDSPIEYQWHTLNQPYVSVVSYLNKKNVRNISGISNLPQNKIIKLTNLIDDAEQKYNQVKDINV